MKIALTRAVFTITRDDGQWAVEHLGQYFDHSADISEVKASANKRARQSQDAGLPCQVSMSADFGIV